MLFQNKILDNLNSLALIATPNREIVYISPSVKEILGFEPEELLGENWWKKTKTTAEETKAAKERLDSFLIDVDTHDKRTFESRVRTKSGRYIYVLWNVSFDDDENIISIGNDITKRKEYEFLLEEKNKQIEESKQELLSNITYSQRIQNAILPNIDRLSKSFADIFVLYKPKDIVSGDFYWFFETEQYSFIAAIDCTGHGVSGALLTTIGNALLREIVFRDKILSPATILHELDSRLFDSLNNNGHEDHIPDGMDIAICRIEKEKNTICFSGAYRPLVIVDKDNNITEIKANRFPIGLYIDVEKIFTETEYIYNETDSFYIFSDGYIDQFGGDKNKKMNKRRFRELLLTINDFTFEERQSFLEYSFNNWRQSTEQIDDILIIGFRP